MREGAERWSPPVAGLGLVLGLMLAACEREVQPSAGDELAGMDDAPSEVRITSPQRVQLTPLGGAAVAALALLTPRDTVTEVAIQMRGSAPGAAHAARIYAGPCGSQGAVLAELDALLTDATGSAGTQQLVRQNPVTLMGGATSVVVYAPGGVVGRPIACGDIPHPEEAAPAPAGALPPAVLPRAPAPAEPEQNPPGS